VADVAQLAALVAPRSLVFSRPIDTDGKPASRERTSSAFAFCRAVYELAGASSHLKLLEPHDLSVLISPR
jgi:hypothetical protein